MEISWGIAFTFVGLCDTICVGACAVIIVACVCFIGGIVYEKQFG